MTQETFSNLILDSESTLYRVAMSMLRNEKDCEDAVQTAVLTAFEKLPDTLTEFTLDNWHGLVDYATVYAEDDIRFTFKNGQEVKA